MVKQNSLSSRGQGEREKKEEEEKGGEREGGGKYRWRETEKDRYRDGGREEKR